ncbi:holo-ACP synthase [bacterium]|nr:holo-ACP synthase [bacterium]
MIKGIGTDILDIKRFERIHLTWGDKLIDKLFNIDEVPSCSSNKKFIQSLAGKFAAKEAISKAFGTGIGSHISFKDIKILNNKKGKPIAIINKLNLEDSIHVSISHSNDYAVAFAVVEKS